MVLGILFLILGLVYSLVIISTVLMVLLDNRQPVKTIAWVLVLVLLPFIGLVFFYFFGQNIRKERLISKKSVNLLMQKAMSEYFTQPLYHVPDDYVRLIKYFERQNLALPFGSNRLKMYNRGDSFLLSLMHEISQAKHHIHLETYIFEDDPVGRMIRDLLVDKVKEGVEVRLIYDDVGCWSVPQQFFDGMARQGVFVEGFMPVRFPRFTHKVNYRNHRKICVIDGKVGFIGGMNIAFRYIKGLDSGIWHDMHIKITGGAVYGLQKTFLTDWFFVTRVMITDPCYYPSLAPDLSGRETIIQIVTSDPVSKWPDIMFGFTWAIQNARKYLYIQSPYFMPTEPILTALQIAAMSGVDVRLMVPLKPDGYWLKWANESYFTEVLRAGVKIYRYKPGFLHAKYLVMDDSLCSIGSTNMDFRSFENNFEANAFIYERETALMVKKSFLEDQNECIELTASIWRKRSYWRRLRESFMRLFSPLL